MIGISQCFPRGIGVYFPAFNWGNEYFGGSTSGIGTGAHMGAGGWWYDHLRTYSPQIIVTHEMGKHHLKLGWQYRYEWMQNFQSVGPGYIGFNSQDTSAVVSGSYNPDQSGDQYATSLLGVVGGASATIYPIVDQVHNHLYAGFIQDDFRLNPRTTLNLGIRWEKESGPSDTNHWLIKTVDMKQNIHELSLVVQPLESAGACRRELAGQRGRHSESGGAAVQRRSGPHQPHRSERMVRGE